MGTDSHAAVADIATCSIESLCPRNHLAKRRAERAITLAHWPNCENHGSVTVRKGQRPVSRAMRIATRRPRQRQSAMIAARHSG
ncbi:hypothetical protein [Rhodococcus globerulus]|uniref:hypothetical protein n=1 Tax=Rhodococcus globerulus TaxID=33008 RepID=UPI00105D2305|nr:hypothetical protein [Rhodococcus globerulus]NMD59941.1 hypothetical protein [Nocardia globerula]